MLTSCIFLIWFKFLSGLGTELANIDHHAGGYGGMWVLIVRRSCSCRSVEWRSWVRVTAKFPFSFDKAGEGVFFAPDDQNLFLHFR